jgi:hypothetical protein
MCSSVARGVGVPKPQPEAISKPLDPNDDASFDVSNTEGTVRGSAVSKQCERMKNPVPRVVSCVALVFVFSVLNANCTRSPHLTEYDEESNKQARSAPLVVVGVVDSDSRVGRPVPSRRDPNYPMQLHRARVKVENVLRGSVSERTFWVFYFALGAGFEGNRPLGFGPEASRRILWLRRDADVFRMACDGWDGCTMFVKSGAHPRYNADPQKSLAYALADILLTRGECKIDEIPFASEIGWGVPGQGMEGYLIGKLRTLALTESSAVKATACVQLWIYQQDRIDSSLRQQARDSLEAAHCVCSLKPDKNIDCQ